MCSLMEHSERSARDHEAQAREPIYTSLAAERGIPYEPPASPLEYEEIRAMDDRLIRRDLLPADSPQSPNND